MFAIYNRIKSIFYPINSNKRKSDESIEVLKENSSINDNSVQLPKLPLTERHSNLSVYNDIFQKNKSVNFVYNDTLPAMESYSVKKFKLDPNNKSIYINGDCILAESKFNMNRKKDIENKDSKVTSVKDQSPNPKLNSLTVKTKSHLLDSKLIENLLKPSIYLDSRQKRLQALQAESHVNKEEIKKYEGSYIEDITECFRELCSIPPVVFPKISKKIQLPKITDQMREDVQLCLMNKHRDCVVVEEFNLSVTVTDMLSLQPRQWLTDNIINFYLELIYSRNNSSSHYPSVQILTTFFYPKLRSSGYSGIKRWTKKRPIFDCQLVLIPIHLGNHWCFVIIDMCNQEVLYYDSLKGPNQECLDLMRTFLIEDSKDKLQKSININEWTFKQIYDGPSQQNGYDCGVFLSQTAEFLSRKAKLEFKQDHMPYFREKMSYEIIQKQLL